MTPKGAQMVIEAMSLRIFQIEEAEKTLSEARFAEEKTRLKRRIKELELVRDQIQPTQIMVLA